MTKEESKARRETIHKLCKDLRAMSEQERTQFAATMPGIVTVEGHPLSVFNTCLILNQQGGESVTVVGGFNQWKSAGRIVRKGEHGFGIWFPRFASRDPGGRPEQDKDHNLETELLGFLIGYVFDVSQTETIGAEVAA